jgi:hypothetical protein
LEDFWAKHDFEHPEEMRIGGLERYQIAGEHWSTWATLTDIRIDIENAVLTVYEQVKDDPARLLALYAATTSATSKDLAYVVPGKGEDAVRWRAVEIRDQLRICFRYSDPNNSLGERSSMLVTSSQLSRYLSNIITSPSATMRFVVCWMVRVRHNPQRSLGIMSTHYNIIEDEQTNNLRRFTAVPHEDSRFNFRCGW